MAVLLKPGGPTGCHDEAFSQLGVGGTELEAVNEKEGIYSETWRKFKTRRAQGRRLVPPVST
jgi:hypothetical protein